eukprot:gene7858-12329_t
MCRLDQGLFYIYLSLQPNKNDKIPFVVVGKKSTKKRCNIISSKDEFEKLFKVITQLIQAFRDKLDIEDPNYKDVEAGFKLIESGWDGYQVNYKKYSTAILKKPYNEIKQVKPKPQQNGRAKVSPETSPKVVKTVSDSMFSTPMKTRLQRPKSPTQAIEDDNIRARKLYTHKLFNQNQNRDANDDLRDIENQTKVRTKISTSELLSPEEKDEEFNLHHLVEQVLITKEHDPKIVTNVPHFIISNNDSSPQPNSPESLSSIEHSMEINATTPSVSVRRSSTGSYSNKRKRENETIFEVLKRNSPFTSNEVRNELKRLKTKKEKLNNEIESIKQLLDQKEEEMEEFEFQELFLKKLTKK